MKNTLLSILLVLSFKICLADQIVCITLSQFKEVQEYVSKDLDLAFADSLENGLFKSVGKNLNYKCDPCKEPFQLGNDNKINELQENKQTTKFIITGASTNGVDNTPDILETEAYIV